MFDMEGFFFAHRGGSVDAGAVMNLVGGDPSLYRKACQVARGNNVRVLAPYRERVDASTGSRQIEREMRVPIRIRR